MRRRLKTMRKAGVQGLALLAAVLLFANFSVRAEGFWVRAQLASPGPGPRIQTAFAGSSDGRMSIFGGLYGGEVLQDLWIFDPQNLSWVRRANGPRRRGMASAWAGGYLYILGGYYGGYYYDDLLKYDPAFNTWSVVSSSVPYKAGYAPQMVSLKDGRLALLRSCEPHGNSPTPIVFYDPQTNTFSSGAVTPFNARNFAGMAVGGSRIFVLGGEQCGTWSRLYDFWMYDIPSNTWLSLPPFPDSMSSVPANRVVASPNGQLVWVLNGPHLWVFDVAAGSWSLAPVEATWPDSGSLMTLAGNSLWAANVERESFSVMYEHKFSLADEYIVVTATVEQDLSLELSPSLVDFGAVYPSRSPYVRLSEVAVAVRANIPWRLFVMGQDLVSGSSSLPLWHRAPGGDWIRVSQQGIQAALGGDTAGTELVMDYKLEVPWTAAPAPHTGQVVYEVVPQ